MGSVAFALLMGWALERAQWLICFRNYNSQYNGYGSIDRTNERNTLAPMAYRVLVPWMIYWLERITKKIDRLTYYQAIKIVLNALVFWSVELAWNREVALATTVLLLLTFRYDYWDWAIELAAIALAMNGNLYLAIGGAFLLGLSRETAPLTALAYWLATGDLLGSSLVFVASSATLAAVRMRIGKRNLYCDRFMMQENWQLIRGLKSWRPIFHADALIAVVITVLTIGAVFTHHPTSPIRGAIPLIVLIAGWTMGRADESRVFAVCLPWIAKMAVG